MEKWSLSSISEFLRIYKSIFYFDVSIALYIYKNDKLSFVTEALGPIKLPLVTQNKPIDISEMKNGHLMAPKNPSDFRQKSIAFSTEHHKHTTMTP